MSANPIDDNATPKTTGSLEELFRHHLGEEATVPPRAMLWDQIDNSLLIRQNETYRKRLAATRWVAAASLLLATLAGTGWWSLRDSHLGRSEMATTSQTSNTSVGKSAASGSEAGAANSPNGANQALNSASSVAATTKSGALASGANGSLTKNKQTAPELAEGSSYAANTTSRATSPADAGAGVAARRGSAPTGFATAERAGTSGTLATATASTSASGSSAAMQSSATTSSATVAARSEQPAGKDGLNTSTLSKDPRAGLLAASTTGSTAVALSPAAPSTLGVLSAGAPAVAALSPAATVAGAEPVGFLASQPAALALGDIAALPTGLAQVSLPETPAPVEAADARKWHYSGSYTAGIFNPNVNFSRVGGEAEFGYNTSPAYGENTVALTEAAAAQYRENLRPGLSQRIALLATRHLAGRWSLSTGAEFTQATAKSATSSAFVGEQILDLGQASNGPMRTTDFRYRMAGIPLEVRYANPVKRGWSLYGRLGGVVSALLGVRSDIEGYPEATRTYSIAAAGAPYRRVLGSVRGAAGAQFRPSTGKWALTLGPVAELGLVPLNAHPAQSYLAQSRPYSFGMEAGMEFGR
jgi:hypothetical protein